MIKIDESGRIRVVRGDTGAFTVIPLNPVLPGREKTPYRLGEGEKIRFIVFVYPENPLLTKESSSQAEDGSVEFYLESADTDLPESTYGYRAKLIKADGQTEISVDTFIGADAGRFEVI